MKGWPLKQKRPGVHAYHKHPVLLLPSGPDKVEALRSHESGSPNRIASSGDSGYKVEGRRQEAEGRGQKLEGRKQEAEVT